MHSTTSPAGVLAQYLSALARSDVRTATGLFAEDAVVHTPCMPAPVPKSISGRAGIAAAYEWAFSQVFGRFEWSRLEVHATDDPHLAFALGASRVQLRDGRLYANEYSIHARVRDGRIVELTEFFDTERAARAFAPPSGA